MVKSYATRATRARRSASLRAATPQPTNRPRGAKPYASFQTLPD
jgi:hypothetical protein